MFTTIFVLICCHLLGDYFLQDDFIATTKGSNWYHLFVHSILYTVPFILTFGFSWWIVLLASSHFFIDALKARYNKINYVQDQILHYLILVPYFIQLFLESTL